jgi:hypothetical protein
MKTKDNTPVAIYIVHRRDGKTTLGQYYNGRRRVFAIISPNTYAENLSQVLRLMVDYYARTGRSFELRGDPYPKLAEELARLELLANYGRNAE